MQKHSHRSIRPSLSAVTLACALGLATLFPPAAVEAAEVHGQTLHWHRVELRFAGPAHDETDSTPNPFLDYRLQCLFIGPSGVLYDVPGFFDTDGEGGDSGNVWTCRFSPDETGIWTYSASFRSGDEIAVSLNAGDGSPVFFDGDSGSFEVFPSDKLSPDFRASDRGRIDYTGNHYLQFRGSGKPWVKGGTNIPENLLAYDGFDNTPDAEHSFAPHVDDWNPGDPDWGDSAGRGIIGALNYLSEAGANSIYFLPMNLGGDGNDTYPTVGENDKTHYDTSKLAQWEIVFTHADRMGIFLHFQLSETEDANEGYHDDGQLGTQRKLYYRELIARFGHHLGIEWDIGEENDYGTELRKEFASYLRSVDPYDHPITTHTKPREEEEYYAPLLGDPNFSMTAAQSGATSRRLGLDVVSWRERSAAAGVPWVISLDESLTIENDRNGNSGYPGGRKFYMWPLYLSGGGGYEWYAQADGGGHELDQKLEDFREMDVALEWTRHALELLDRLPLLDMTADPSASDAKHTFSDPGRIYVTYNLDDDRIDIDLRGFGEEFSVRWLDPESGEWFAGPTVAGGSVRDIGDPPFNGDNVGLIVARSALTDVGLCAGDTDCDDDNACTDNRCDPMEGCVHENNTAACDDGGCRPDGRCAEGVCTGTPLCAGGAACSCCGDDTCKPRCGVPSSCADEPTATDALFILNTAIGLEACERCACDVDDSGRVTVVDSLQLLSMVVGNLETTELQCPDAPD